ncbi:hypothetical protein [Desulfurococcus mucosus]|uniref:Uncharacterized protein n=1 Tax=Desulfurococcus mucosus (strain ATCC 35584 / DSM 2162 / JCM 9187 / O7/1) TaxID=765177 RepID=E8R8X4_DESM0|nr:hypothetical protein [Desulfurococcus mucosus]ADV64950.1 hypothetical protein Desmu_0642 [Desulfurococcus mucosus DSM 2162]
MPTVKINFYGVELELGDRLTEVSSRIPLGRMLQVLEVTLLAELHGKYFTGEQYSEALRDHLEALLKRGECTYIHVKYRDAELHMLLLGRLIVNSDIEPQLLGLEVVPRLLEETPEEVLVYAVHVPVLKLDVDGLIEGELGLLMKSLVDALNTAVVSIVRGELDELSKQVGEIDRAVAGVKRLAKSKSTDEKLRRLGSEFLGDLERLVGLHRAGDYIGFLGSAILVAQAVAYSCSRLRSSVLNHAAV